jgi:DNA-binding winged helix-turn-helix (wHTH) protein
MVLEFGDFELDVGARELRRAGETIPLQPKVFDTLRYLVEHRDHIVSKQELLDAFWEGESLNPVAVPWSISHARKALGQRRSDTAPIETVRGRGYRFVSAVRGAPDLRGEARAEGAAPVQRPSTRAGAEPLLGRADAMQRLQAALAEARAGRGRVCLLTGDAGIGKTRCAEELAGFARRSGLAVWLGRCVDAGGAPAFWPWIQILRAASAHRHLESPERKAVNAMLARLTPRANPDDDAARVSTPALPDTSRFWLSEALVRCLRQTAETRLRVLVLEDLHAADAGSLEVLSLLAPELERTRMLVVATSRGGPGAAGPAGAPSLAQLACCEVIGLSGLSFEDTHRYVSEALGQAASLDLVRVVHERTAGNPLLLKEGVRLVASRLGRRDTLRAADVDLPDVARQLLIERLATLDGPTRQVLEAAAVVGEEFELAVLQRVAEMPGESILARLDAARQGRFVETHGEGGWRFAHALIRDALEGELPAAQSRRLHARVAEALAGSVAVGPRLGAVAYHLYRALPEAKASDAALYSRLAGDAAMQVFAYDEAAERYGWGLAALGYAAERDARGGCELGLARTLALRRAGRVPEARAQCREAIEIALRDGFPELLVEAARALRPTVWAARVPDTMALRALEQAIERLPESAKGVRAQAYALLAFIPPHSSNIAASRELAERAVGLAREAGDRQLYLAALVSSFHGLTGADAIDQLLARTDEVLRLDGPAVTWWSAEAFYGRHGALLQAGDARAAERALESFGECAQRLRMPEAIWQYERVRAQKALYTGDFDAAAARFHRLFSEGTRFRTEAMFQYAAQMNALSWERDGRPLAAAALGPSPDIAWKWAAAIPSYRAEKILGLLELGERQAARAEFDDLAQGGFEGVTRDTGYLFTLCRLAQAAVSFDDHDAAGALYDLLLPHAAHVAIDSLFISLGSVSHYLGILSRFTGRRAEAAAHFAQAVKVNTRIGHPVHARRSEAALSEPLGGQASAR